MSADRLQRLHDAGVSIWLDTLSRELLDSGAFTRLIAQSAVTGATSNPTIFARAITASTRQEQVIDAYLTGLERRVATGQPVDSIASVASFFVSRLDSKADSPLPADSLLRGRVAIANAHRAYARYRRRFADERWRALRDAGAAPQRPLWAGTATKNPAYSDVLYVEQLIAPDVINTMTEATLRAFADHGVIGDALDADGRAADDVLRRAAEAGIDLAALTGSGSV